MFGIEGVFYEKYEKYLLKNYFQPPPYNCAYYFSGGSTPTRWLTLRHLPLVRAGRNGMGSVSDLLNSKHRNCLGSNNTPPPVMYAPDPLQIYPLYSIIFCYQLVNRPFLGGGYFVKIIFWKTISKPPHNCAYYFSGGSTPTRWITLRRLP